MAFRRHSARRKSATSASNAEDETGENREEKLRAATEMMAQFAPTNHRLLEALRKHSGVRPRSPEWLFKFIDSLYKAKMHNDEQRTLAGSPKQTLADFMFKHLAGKYPAPTPILSAHSGT